ncbi:hypothetical protein [Rhodococcus qingshengii]|uniref:hypothetical protein n=1 Tax=Rhodococcus qingshengii TaxID=334542 RepID=UPI001C5CEBEB|nr:hypothetical protein [Rhodococcus qingshengii]MBW4813151.1 hypothetical protein [Rhodococcus qingshengii]
MSTNKSEPFLNADDLPTLRKLADFMSDVAKESDSKMKKMMFEMFAGILGGFVRDIEAGVSS